MHTLPQVGILQHIVCGKLLRVDALQAQHLDARAREAALRGLGGALHEEHDGGRADGLVDGLADGIGEEAALGGEGEEEGGGPDRGGGGGGGADRREGRLADGLEEGQGRTWLALRGEFSWESGGELGELGEARLEREGGEHTRDSMVRENILAGWGVGVKWPRWLERQICRRRRGLINHHDFFSGHRAMM